MVFPRDSLTTIKCQVNTYYNGPQSKTYCKGPPKKLLQRSQNLNSKYASFDPVSSNVALWLPGMLAWRGGEPDPATWLVVQFLVD